MGSAVNISPRIVCACGPTSGIHSAAIDHGYTPTIAVPVAVAKVVPLPHIGVIPVSVSISVAGGGSCGNEAHASRRTIGRGSELVGAPSIGEDAQIHTTNRDALIGLDDDTDIKCYRTTHNSTGGRGSNGNTDCLG